MEPEIAFIFDKEVKGPSCNGSRYTGCNSIYRPCTRNYRQRFQGFSFTLPDAVADNSSSSRFIIGERFYSPDNSDLKLMGMVFKQNGEVVATGAGAAVMGHPARAIAWMANRLYKVGQSIQPGEVVLSGSLSAATKIEAGDHFSASFDGIGSCRGCIYGINNFVKIRRVVICHLFKLLFLKVDHLKRKND